MKFLEIQLNKFKVDFKFVKFIFFHKNELINSNYL